MENNKATLLGVAVPEALGGISNPGFSMSNGNTDMIFTKDQLALFGVVPRLTSANTKPQTKSSLEPKQVESEQPSDGKLELTDEDIGSLEEPSPWDDATDTSENTQLQTKNSVEPKQVESEQPSDGKLELVDEDIGGLEEPSPWDDATDIAVPQNHSEKPVKHSSSFVGFTLWGGLICLNRDSILPPKRLERKEQLMTHNQIFTNQSICGTKNQHRTFAPTKQIAIRPKLLVQAYPTTQNQGLQSPSPSTTAPSPAENKPPAEVKLNLWNRLQQAVKNTKWLIPLIVGAMGLLSLKVFF
jgi:hypothetical protein